MSMPSTQTAMPTATPRIEILLAAAHGDLATLERRREALVRAGVPGEHLATPDALMAFALLGDHERDPLLADLRPEWSGLQARGLVHGDIDAASTAELRLLTHCRAQLDAIGLVWTQLEDAHEAPEPPARVWRCARRVRGIWGEVMRVHFQMDGISSLLIDPDPIFGLRPTLLAADPERRHTGAFSIPLDAGEVRLSMRHRDGELYRHVLEAVVEEVN